jgi:hypothetical protein
LKKLRPLYSASISKMLIDSFIADLGAALAFARALYEGLADLAFVRALYEDLVGLNAFIWSLMLLLGRLICQPIDWLLILMHEELATICGAIGWLRDQLVRFLLLIGIDMRQRAGIYRLCRDYEHLPELDLNGRMGATGYIDCVTADMMPRPIMRGQDQYGRHFLAIKVRVEGLNTPEVVGTFFHRYFDSTALAFGTCYSPNIIFNDARVRSDEDTDYLAERIRLLRRGRRMRSLNIFAEDWEPNMLISGNSDITLWGE